MLSQWEICTFTFRNMCSKRNVKGLQINFNFTLKLTFHFCCSGHQIPSLWNKHSSLRYDFLSWRISYSPLVEFTMMNLHFNVKKYNFSLNFSFRLRKLSYIYVHLQKVYTVNIHKSEFLFFILRKFGLYQEVICRFNKLSNKRNIASKFL